MPKAFATKARQAEVGSKRFFESRTPPSLATYRRRSDASFAAERIVFATTSGGVARSMPFCMLSRTALANGSYASSADQNTLYGLGDGGAHYGLICDSSMPTFMLTYWTRDRPAGGLLAVEEVVKRLSSDTATHVGLQDRGRIAPGYKADLNVIDYERLTLHAPSVKYDLPGGARRLRQATSGYVATIVSGQITYRDGEPTGALPGVLVRGAQAIPLSS